MNFPTVDSAIGYIKDSLQTFFNQSQVLKDRLGAIGKLKLEAQKRNDQEALGRLILMQEQVKTLFQEQLAIEDKLKPFADYFGVNMALGLFPVALAVAGVGLATLMFLHFEKLKNQAKALDLIAKGMLPPAEAEAILNPGFFSGIIGGGVSSMFLPLAGLAALYLFLTTRKG